MLLLLGAGSAPAAPAAFAAYGTITITDGTTTATLTDGSNYALVDGGWAPGVTRLRAATLGGRGPYEDVLEELTVNVMGTSGAVCLANLGTLSNLLDQAERWGRGEPVNAVTVTYQPQGSTLAAALSAVIVARGREGGLVNPPAFNDLLMCYEIPNVLVSFVRRGLWLGAAETTSTSAAADNPTVHTVSFASAQTISGPAAVTVAVQDTAHPPFGLAQIYLLVAKSADRIVIIEAESMTAGVTVPARWSTQADAAAVARGGSVHRLVATAAGQDDYLFKAAPGLHSSVRRVGLFAALRNTHSATSFTVHGRLYAGGNVVDGPTVYVDTSSNVPQMVFLGVVTAPAAIAEVSLWVNALSTPDAGSLDIDYIVLIGLDDETSAVLRIDAGGSPYAYIAADLSVGSLAVSAQPLTATTPLLSNTVTGNTVYQPYQGDAWLNTAGTTVAATLLGCSDGYWRLYHALGPDTVLAQTKLTASRWPAYLTPQ